MILQLELQNTYVKQGWAAPSQTCIITFPYQPRPQGHGIRNNKQLYSMSY